MEDISYVTRALGKFKEECPDSYGRLEAEKLFQDYHIHRNMAPEAYHNLALRLVRLYFKKSLKDYLGEEED